MCDGCNSLFCQEHGCLMAKSFEERLRLADGFEEPARKSWFQDLLRLFF